jgi:hypothetical protein
MAKTYISEIKSYNFHTLQKVFLFINIVLSLLSCWATIQFWTLAGESNGYGEQGSATGKQDRESSLADQNIPRDQIALSK